MEHRVLICNFTGVYEREGLTASYDTLELSGLPGTGMYIDDGAEEEIRQSLSDAGFPGDYRIRFLDNGNYHYMTRIMASFIKEPFDLITFDNHTDDQPPAFEGIRSCGSWRLDMALENRYLRRSMLIQRASEFDLAYIPSDLPLYISLDKDILSAGVLKTNWDQGDMETERLFSFLRRLYEEREIVAFDICGEALPDEPCGQNAEFNLRLIEEFLQ
ncbi:MAG: hypothetical protein J5966_05220 [Lachnospiraceae bacterium]|nr:hypothetical protein [Lachnospiraceae bacterium]